MQGPMSYGELNYILDSVEILSKMFKSWGNNYRYNPATNEVEHGFFKNEEMMVSEWFSTNLFKPNTPEHCFSNGWGI